MFTGYLLELPKMISKFDILACEIELKLCHQSLGELFHFHSKRLFHDQVRSNEDYNFEIAKISKTILLIVDGVDELVSQPKGSELDLNNFLQDMLERTTRVKVRSTHFSSVSYAVVFSGLVNLQNTSWKN
jgi:hypothetical protein